MNVRSWPLVPIHALPLNADNRHTRERIEAAAAQLNYVPSSQAQGLSSGRTNAVAVLVPLGWIDPLVALVTAALMLVAGILVPALAAKLGAGAGSDGWARGGR